MICLAVLSIVLRKFKSDINHIPFRYLSGQFPPSLQCTVLDSAIPERSDNDQDCGFCSKLLDDQIKRPEFPLLPRGSST